MHFITVWSHFIFIIQFLSLVEAKFYRPHQYHTKAGLNPHHDQGKPTSRHKNHCAYVTEKTVPFTVQDGAAPYVKAEYNKCSWGQKCPTLMYRLMYKPVYKVAHKTVTELEWRCCPGYSGYGCMEGPPVYQHRMMPPFKGPPMKGPQFKEPQFKGPQYKGPMFKGPMFKGPPIHGAVKANPWSQPNGQPPSGFNSYPMHHFGPPRTSSYPDTSFESFEPESEPESMPDHQEPHHTEHDQEHEPSQGPEEHILEEIPPPSSGGEQPEGETVGQTLDNETEERIFRMEEDVQRLNQGLETLRGTVNGLEESLRASLREDANRMLSALLSAAPGPIPAPAIASSLSTVGFVEIPGGGAEAEGLDGRQVFSGFTELSGRVEELRAELQAKMTELQELKATVKGHDGQLVKMSNRAGVKSDSTGNFTTGALENLMDAKLNAARTEVLGGFEKRVETAEGKCEEKAGDVRRQCQREQAERQEKIEDALHESSTDLRTEVRNIQAQIHDFKDTDGCCGRMSGLVERVQLLEMSVGGLNQSQGHLRVELGGHKDHIEGILEGRLGYIEDELGLTGQIKNGETGRRSGNPHRNETGQDLEARMEGKLRAVESRLLTALEELGNATAPALLEGHAVPTLETEVESLRERLEVDVDRVQKHLTSLEILCSSSHSSTQRASAIQGDSAEPNTILAAEQSMKDVQDLQDDRLNTLNITLQNILQHLSLKDQQIQAERDTPFQGELTILKFNVRSVNRTLKVLQNSLGTVIHKVGQANDSWHEREARLAQQIKGVVQLVGHQASMLGAGERRLIRLKAELLEMKRRLAEEVRGCRSTAMGVQKEVTEVNGRVATVEDKCKGLTYLADDLEKIREELEKQSNGLLLQVNGTLSSHAQQLTELRGELRNCTEKAEPTQQSLEVEAVPRRGDIFTIN
ncbi:EMILIN-3-like [Solea senegalensis]|uniref:EMILIN-3-like n=1 Tax=Solea senegalensis TaxID=28829 RepID=A0AAV6STJ0_SOLSE|nr:EMILIN-3-like [Solea senegalensis]KAG7520968.1 EMILIN-3-like [Solea senegalensis]